MKIICAWKFKSQHGDFVPDDQLEEAKKVMEDYQKGDDVEG